MLHLLETAAKMEHDKRRFHAAIHGIDFDKAIEEKSEADEEGVPKVFKEPGHYDHLPIEERKKMTEEMKENFMRLSSVTPIGDKHGR